MPGYHTKEDKGDGMKFWFRGHHYNTQIKHNLRNMLWLDNYHGWRWRYFNKIWFGHEDDCCDYWTPVSDPKAQRAFMLDDELGLATPGADTAVSDLVKENPEK